MYAIEIQNLIKSFGEVRALDDITFQVREGALFSFLGKNGAGKSTTISILVGQVSKDLGEVRVNGWDVDRHGDKIKGALGVVFQNSALDRVLTVRENLRTRAALYGLVGKAFERRLQELIYLLELEELLDRTLGKLSGGQQRRIDVARALIHRPGLLILDEPTAGLDPESRILVWQVICRLRKAAGLTVFYSTHYMEEAAQADRIVILDRGRIAAEGTPNDLKTRYAGDFIRLYGVERGLLEKRRIPYFQENGYLKIPVGDPAGAKALFFRHAELFQDFEIVKGTMDDVFLAATGNRWKED